MAQYRILIVEDDETIAKMEKEYLEIFKRYKI